jgi:hypothetical protein
MCKSPKRENAVSSLALPMLMLSELPNWLLFRALEAEKTAAANA